MAHRVITLSGSRASARLLERLSRGDVPSITSLRKAARSLLGNARTSSTNANTSTIDNGLVLSVKEWRQVFNSDMPKGGSRIFANLVAFCVDIDDV